MKKILLSLGRQFLFWILFFDLSRLVFMIFYASMFRSAHVEAWEIAGIFIHSFRLDAAVAAYFLIVPFLILAVQCFSDRGWLNTVNKIYTAIMVVAYSLTETGEMGIYREWQAKLSYKALRYLMHPTEVYNSAETGTFFLLLAILVALSGTGIFMYLKWFYRNLPGEKKNPFAAAAFILLGPGILFLIERGGAQQIPINQSQSYFSKHEIVNQVSVNNAFNLFVSIFENFRVMKTDPYVFMDQPRAEAIVKKLFAVEKDSTVQLLTTRRPNIVLIILESFSGDLIESLGGKPGITPEFRRLEQEGVLFTRLYSAGMRSEQGMAAIFGGFPAHPQSCSVIQPEKYHALPSLPGILKKQGYFTSFYFGGQLIYGNIRGYIYYNRFDKIVEGSDFPDSIPRGKLGVHDGYTLARVAHDLPSNPEPFFTALFTLSSHSPYDQPWERPLTWGGPENDYINSALYTDHCLGEFFRKVKKEPWYPNTLFILVADHSHNSYYQWNPAQKEYRRIPMLWLGDVIDPKYRGTTWDKLGNQHDLPATLLEQLALPHDSFPWSRNLLNPLTPGFAYFSNENGYGWVRPGMEISLDLGKEWPYVFNIPVELQDSVKREGEAYLQVLFRQYLDQ